MKKNIVIKEGHASSVTRVVQIKFTRVAANGKIRW